MAASPNPTNRSTADSSTGLDSNIAGALCYLAGFVTGVVFLVIEKRDREVRFHAFQSAATFGTLFVLSIVASALPFIGTLVALILSPISLIQALPTVLRQPWREVEPDAEQTPTPGEPDKQAGSPGFFQRDEFEDFSLRRVVLGYGISTLAALSLATLSFCMRDL